MLRGSFRIQGRIWFGTPFVWNSRMLACVNHMVGDLINVSNRISANLFDSGLRRVVLPCQHLIDKNHCIQP